MKHIKKLACLLALVTAMAAFASCGTDNTGSSEQSSEASVEDSLVESSVEESVADESNTEPSDETDGESSETAVSSELETLVNSLYEGISEEDLPATMVIALDEANSEYNVGVPFSDYKEGVASDAMINAIAHSVCLVRANSADEAADLAAKIEENADPRKWVCVEAEKKAVAYHDDLVLLVMSSEVVADQVLANFDAAFAE